VCVCDIMYMKQEEKFLIVWMWKYMDFYLNILLTMIIYVCNYIRKFDVMLCIQLWYEWNMILYASRSSWCVQMSVRSRECWLNIRISNVFWLDLCILTFCYICHSYAILSFNRVESGLYSKYKRYLLSLKTCLYFSHGLESFRGKSKFYVNTKWKFYIRYIVTHISVLSRLLCDFILNKQNNN